MQAGAVVICSLADMCVCVKDKKSPDSNSDMEPLPELLQATNEMVK